MVVSWTRVTQWGWREVTNSKDIMAVYNRINVWFEYEVVGEGILCIVLRFLTFEWDVGASDKRGKYGKERCLGGFLSYLVVCLVTFLSIPVRSPRDLASSLNSNFCRVLAMSFVSLRAREMSLGKAHSHHLYWLETSHIWTQFLGSRLQYIRRPV